MRLTTLSPVGEPRTTRDRIVWQLANRQVMTFRRLQRNVANGKGRISAQGLYKHLNPLMEDGLVERHGRGEYALSLQWVRSLKKLCEDIEHNRRVLRME